MWKLFRKKPEGKALEKGKQEDKPKKAKSDRKEVENKGKKDEKRPEKKSMPRSKRALARVDRILIKPVISEKASYASSVDTYTFSVSKNANKVEIKKAFISMYDIEPVSVRIINTAGKRKSIKRIEGFRSSWKKALIRLPKGKKIDVFEGV